MNVKKLTIYYDGWYNLWEEKFVPQVGEGGCPMCNPMPRRTTKEGDEGHPPSLRIPPKPKTPKVKRGYTAQQFIEWDNEE